MIQPHYNNPLARILLTPHNSQQQQSPPGDPIFESHFRPSPSEELSWKESLIPQTLKPGLRAGYLSQRLSELKKDAWSAASWTAALGATAVSPGAGLVTLGLALGNTVRRIYQDSKQGPRLTRQLGDPLEIAYKEAQQSQVARTLGMAGAVAGTVALSSLIGLAPAALTLAGVSGVAGLLVGSRSPSKPEG